MDNSKSSIQNPKLLIQTDIIEYLKRHEEKELLRFITCGSVDDGKSTLIGRLLYETRVVFEDQLLALKAETKYKRTEEEIDFSLLVDGLQAEREQGITIDVAHRYFSTDKRKFIIADTPGHEQYTRNMLIAASNADVAVILIDARNGVLTQTRRHSFLVTLMGIKKIAVAINKMDLVGYSEEVYKKIVRSYSQMFDNLRYALPFKKFEAEVEFIPISALKGDNVVKKSENMPWYEGKTLLGYLDTVEVEESFFYSKGYDKPFRLPVQYVNRPHLEFRGYCGTIVSGKISVGDEIIVYPSGVKTQVKSIILPDYKEGDKNEKLKYVDEASSPMPVTIQTEAEIDISRGDLIVKAEEEPPRFNDSFEAFLVWMDEEPLEGREYILKIYTKEVRATISKILFKKDVNSWEKLEAKILKLNDIARVQIDLAEKIAFDFYDSSRAMGGFILIDRITNYTSAAGIIVGESTRRKEKRVYTEAEIALNRYIREHFPEWECKSIDEIE